MRLKARPPANTIKRLHAAVDAVGGGSHAAKITGKTRGCLYQLLAGATLPDILTADALEAAFGIKARDWLPEPRTRA